MNIYYDSEAEEWFHSVSGEQLFLGKDSSEVPYSPLNDQVFLKRELTIFPGKKALTAAILTTPSSKRNQPFSGNHELFKDLHLHLLSKGIFSYVFTAETMLGPDCRGYIYQKDTDSWTDVKVPLPDIVYNRIPSRSFETSDTFKRLTDYFSRHSILLFNQCFIDKWELYEIFSEDPAISRHLPDTIHALTFQKLRAFLTKHRHVYFKHRKGNQGKGIFTIKELDGGTIEMATMTGSQIFLSFEEFWEQRKEDLSKKKWIAQQAITPQKKEGHRFDYRLLVHYQNGQYKLTGKAVRISQTQEITTHTARGGILGRYERFQSPALEKQFARLANRCGTVLSEKKGFFGEFSIDIGIDTDGRLYMYEINSKPMQFDEPYIEEQRLASLSSLFIELIFPQYECS
ncbi:YheC/YheD family endospore coat-associated protein [Bacillus massiliglaciei]|uniref:YheC/YheD family endospore coat-associated protein n=1 Tax=Bacillus massiliglaciei TaxID=1816693 RepID=UPI000DA60494|nr:YheC/YheD family protein [Bacillus massiliglaciei]